MRFEGVRISGRPQGCRLLVRLPQHEEPFVRIAIRQLHEGKEVGRLTRHWRLLEI